MVMTSLPPPLTSRTRSNPSVRTSRNSISWQQVKLSLTMWCDCSIGTCYKFLGWWTDNHDLGQVSPKSSFVAKTHFKTLQCWITDISILKSPILSCSNLNCFQLLLGLSNQSALLVVAKVEGHCCYLPLKTLEDNKEIQEATVSLIFC